MGLGAVNRTARLVGVSRLGRRGSVIRARGIAHCAPNDGPYLQRDSACGGKKGGTARGRPLVPLGEGFLSWHS